MIYATTLLFAITFVLAFRYRRKRLAAERKRQVVQTWPRAVASFTSEVPEAAPLPGGYPQKANPPQTEYQYTVRGTKYTGYYLSPAEELINAGTDSRALQQLRSANEWRIYYNPAAPTEAYLSPGPPRVQNIHLVLDFFFLVFIPVVMLFSWYGRLTHS
ncbi:MAG: DUF3592 domain-containing protein [Lewinella sp.]